MDLTSDDILSALSDGEIESLGLMPWSSNYTFLVKVAAAAGAGEEAAELLAVYKPRKGESPLWDFAEGTLCLREQAAYLVSRMLGWGLVPPTVLRNGPQGFGSVQLFIENDPNQHYFAFREDPALSDQLMRLVVFDLITNNADRKSGHCLLDTDGHVWAIDHGITFNADYKLRTVIWDFANQPIPLDLLADLQALLPQLEPGVTLGKALRQLLMKDEIAAFRRRVEGLIALGHFPAPSRNQRSVPWPPV